MRAALNPKRYRVEHLFDLDEALLRAKIVLAHCLVVHTDSVDALAIGKVGSISERCTPVLVSCDEQKQELAQELGGQFVDDQFDTYTFKRAVYRAVAKTHKERLQTQQWGLRNLRGIVLLCADHARGSVIAAVLCNQLSATCKVATSPREVLSSLEEIDCVVADTSLLMTSQEGADLAAELARLGVPVVPLADHDDLDASSAGQTAWDIAPYVRRTLSARRTIRPAG